MGKRNSKSERDLSDAATGSLIGIAVVTILLFMLALFLSCFQKSECDLPQPPPSFTQEQAATLYPPVGQNE